MQITIKHVPIFPDNPLNPAKSNIATGVITINDSVWNNLSPIEQDYWMAHEEGHIRNAFGSEVDADTYAFQKIAGSQIYSLRDIRRTLRKIIATNPNAPEAKARLLNNAQLSLEFASSKGSESAKQLLSKQQTQKTMTTAFVNSSTLTFPATTTIKSTASVATTTVAKATTAVANPVTATTKATTTAVVKPIAVASASTPKTTTKPVTTKTETVTAVATATKDTLISTVPVFDGGVTIAKTTLDTGKVENKTILPTTGNTIYSGSSAPTPAPSVVGNAPIPEAVQNGTAPKEEVARVVAQQTEVETPVQDVVVEKKTKQNSKRYIVIVAIVAVVIYLLYKSKK